MQGVQGGRNGGGLISQSGWRPCSGGFLADLELALADIVTSLQQVASVFSCTVCPSLIYFIFSFNFDTLLMGL